jgi:hypothetical protein
MIAEVDEQRTSGEHTKRRSFTERRWNMAAKKDKKDKKSKKGSKKKK